jgi:hypothetical protein
MLQNLSICVMCACSLHRQTLRSGVCARLQSKAEKDLSSPISSRARSSLVRMVLYSAVVAVPANAMLASLTRGKTRSKVMSRPEQRREETRGIHSWRRQARCCWASARQPGHIWMLKGAGGRRKAAFFVWFCFQSKILKTAPHCQQQIAAHPMFRANSTLRTGNRNVPP